MKKNTPTLKDEILQSRDFPVPEAEVFLNLMRTAEALVGEVATFLRGHGLSPSQYNVLRILQGAGDEALSGLQIMERMVTRDSDMTRLLKGLENKRLILRFRSEEDRRAVLATITPAGKQLLAAMGEPLNELHRQQLGHMSEARLRRFNSLLEEARRRP